jgi:hypothetical protein
MHSATYLSPLPGHSHEEFAIGAIAEGVRRICGGDGMVLSADSLWLMNSEELPAAGYVTPCCTLRKVPCALLDLCPSAQLSLQSANSG